MRVCYQAGNTFGSSCTAQHSQPLLYAPLALRAGCETLESLIECPLDRALSHAKVARAQAFVESPDALVSEDLLDHLPGAPD